MIEDFNFCKDYFILDPNKSIEFELKFPFLPVSENERLQTTRKGKVYKNPIIDRQRDLVYLLMKTQGLHTKLDTFSLKAYSLDCLFLFSHKQLLTQKNELRKNDLDNYIKILQDQIIYFFKENNMSIDDCQCIDIHLRKWFDENINDKDTIIKVKMNLFY